MADAKGFEPDVKVRTRDYKIGCIGAGMIMAECHLAAYKEAGFPVAAIASRTKANAEKVAKRWGIPKVHTTRDELIRDETIEILDVAYPLDQQPALIRLALEQKHIKAILAQKPLARSGRKERCGKPRSSEKIFVSCGESRLTLAAMRSGSRTASSTAAFTGRRICSSIT